MSEDTTTPTGVDFGNEDEEDQEELQEKERRREEERACYEAVEEVVDEALSHLESLHKEKEGKFLEDLEKQEEQRVKLIEEEEEQRNTEKEVRAMEKEEEGEDNSNEKESEFLLNEGFVGLPSSGERCMNDGLSPHAAPEEERQNEVSAGEEGVDTRGEPSETSRVSHQDQREKTSESDLSGVGEETRERDALRGEGEERDNSHSGVCTPDKVKNVDSVPDAALQGDGEKEEHTLSVREASQTGTEESQEDREMDKERQVGSPSSPSSPPASAEQGRQQEGERGSGVHTPQALGEQPPGENKTSHFSSSVSSSSTPSSSEEHLESIDRKIARGEHDSEKPEVGKEDRSEDFNGCLKAGASSSLASKLIAPDVEESDQADTQVMRESGIDSKEAEEEEERRKERQDLQRDDGQVNGEEEKTSFSVSLPKEGEEEPVDGHDRKEKKNRQKEGDCVRVDVSLNEIPATDVTIKKEDEQEEEQQEEEDEEKKEEKMRGVGRKDKMLPNDDDDDSRGTAKRFPLLPCPSREGPGPASEENGDGGHLSSSRRSSLSERRASFCNSKRYIRTKRRRKEGAREERREKKEEEKKKRERDNKRDIKQ